MAVSIIPIERAASMGIQIPQELYNMPPQQYGSMGGGAMGAGMQDSGYGSPMGGMDYSGYLKELINANSANPSFQRQLLGEYISSLDPRLGMENQMAMEDMQMRRKQMEMENQQMMMNLAISLLESTDPGAIGTGNRILQELLGESIVPAEAQSSGYYDLYRENLQSQLPTQESILSMSPDEYAFTQFLAQAPDETIQRYESPVTWDERVNKAREYKGWNPIENIAGLISMWNGEDIRRGRIGYGQ